RPRREARASCGLISRSAKGCQHEVIRPELDTGRDREGTFAWTHGNGRDAPKAVIDNSLFGPSTRTASLTREREQSRTRLGPGPRRVRVPRCNRFITELPQAHLAWAVHWLVFRDRTAIGCARTLAIRATAP